MKYGICNISIVPLRAEESHRSEMVSQLLFGESFEMIQEAKDWVQIRTSYDGYVGWIQQGQFIAIDDSIYYAYQRQPKQLVGSEGACYLAGNRKILLLHGTLLSDSFSYYPLEGLQTTTGHLFVPTPHHFKEQLNNLAVAYRDVPYLWGGKSKYGIDCSGFSQLMYKSFGMALPRDAYQQAEEGRVVDFIAEIQAGDLAFFDNEAGKITHVGIMLDQQTIIHASSRVRIDKMDAEGIFNPELNRYSHTLRIVKRYL